MKTAFFMLFVLLTGSVSMVATFMLLLYFYQ